MNRILVWDLPTRVFHWLLAASFAGAFLTSESERLADLHVTLGYTTLGLVAFRVLWGLLGTRYARFGAFLFGPSAVARYLASVARLRPEHHLGHNPAGSWAIFLLLALTVLTAGSGYLCYQDLGGDLLEEVHEALANTMLVVVAVHVAGVLLSSLLHQENLVASMVTGRKVGEPALAIRGSHWLVALALGVAVIAYWAGFL
ncbi:MAG: cytochrome b/b6 domain-containing protein [Gammaproteobacteria bacterium]|nr:cytochrome b/b6 domain-containing protein [Gammaproteobacteria bacterium]